MTSPRHPANAHDSLFAHNGQTLDSSPVGIAEEPQAGGGHRLAANRIPF